MKKKIAVVGGGAAGMMAAIQAAEAGAQVDLYERNDRVGKKLLATGNGKCNFSNRKMTRQAYHGSGLMFYDKLFSEFGTQDTVDLFGQFGMLVKEKNGCLYPLSEQASTVLDVLRIALKRQDVRIHTGCKVECVKKSGGDGFLLTAEGKDAADGADAGKKEVYYDAVILACGGKAAPKTGSDGNGYRLAEALGHTLVDVVPALVQLRCQGSFWKSVAGVRTEAELVLSVDHREAGRVRGELQFTDYGISGIPVFQFSREAAYGIRHRKEVTVSIDFLPQYDRESYEKLWEERWERQGHQNLEQFLTGIANKKINQLMMKLSGMKSYEPVRELSGEKRRALAGLYRNLNVTVQETNGFEQAQVSAGGISARELTGQLESRFTPNLYFAGEIIDMDGICGGYNLQWAWTSGVTAGRAAAKSREKDKAEG